MTSLSSLGVSPSIVAKLSEADIFLDSDVCGLKPTELTNASQLTLKESSEVIRLASSKPSSLLSKVVNLKELVERNDDIDHIVTFCGAIDDLLGGGIPLKAITEISGTPGVGKTQMCLQACISVQLKERDGGVQGEAVFIDTEGSFNVLRLKEMCDWAEKHLRQVQGAAYDPESFSVEAVLKGIHYFRCHSHLELLAVIKHLYGFLPRHPSVRLVAVDSIAFHFRHDFTDMMARTSLLCSITQDLIQMAAEHRLAVLVTNQMTTRVEGPGCSQVVTALGETWGHCPTLRLLLYWSGNLRAARVTKAPHIPKASVYFQITPGGVRDKKIEAEIKDKGTKRKIDQD